MAPLVKAPILLAIDGEPHSVAAVHRALAIAAARGLPLTAVHVKDPYLKQFAGEIYAQGREEFCAHVDACLATVADAAAAEARKAAALRGVEITIKVIEGDALSALENEIRIGRYGLVVMGAGRRRGLGAWRSRRLPDRLGSKLDGVPFLLVPGAG